jgi:CHAD domain-containing protein
VLGALAVAGVGALLARTELQRRRARLAKPNSEPSLNPAEPLAAGCKRVALQQFDLAIELLETSSQRAGTESVAHEARKSLKRIRALLRLLREDLGEQRFTHENAVLRDSARNLAPTRDTEALVETLDDLIERFPVELGARRGVRRLRSGLAARRDRLAPRNEDVAKILGDLYACRLRLYTWDPPDRAGTHVLAGFERLYRRGHRRARLARRSKPGQGGYTVAMHDWRKRVKDLRYGAETLGLQDVARRAERLGDTLGEDHDLALLEGFIGDHGRHLGAGSGSRKALRKAIAQRRERLHRRARGRGAELYAKPPKKLTNRLRGKFSEVE